MNIYEIILFWQDDVIRTVCIECGVDSTGSRSDLLLRLCKELKSKQTYDKIYSKIWSASGEFNLYSTVLTQFL